MTDLLTSDAAYDRLRKMYTPLFAEATIEPVPWVPGAAGLLRAGIKAVWYGPRGCGKTIAATVQAIDTVGAGGTVAYLDLENGRRRMRQRVDAILADRPPRFAELMRDPERFDYADRVQFGAFAEDEATMLAEWKMMLDERDLVIIDSWTRVLGQLEAEENSNSAIARFVTRFVDPLAHGGAAVLILDNTGKDESAEARGGEAKMSLTELAYRVTGARTCSQAKHGAITLKRTRSRDGDEAPELRLGAGGGAYTRLEPPTDLLDAVRGVLPQPSKRAVAAALRERGIRVRTDALNKMLDGWVADGSVAIDGETYI